MKLAEVVVKNVSKVGLWGKGFFAETKNLSNKEIFDLAPRVEQQLVDPRMGSLAGKLDKSSLNELAGNPNAQLLYDVGTGNINIINNVDGKLLRITTPRDSFKIISVGPIQERNVINSIKSGRFIPIGNQLEESSDLVSYMNRIKR